MLSCVQLVVTPWTTKFLCPWDFPGKKTKVGCHFLLQGILLIQGLNPCLLHLLYWQADSLPLSHLGCPLGKSTRVQVGLGGCMWTLSS